jgi:hypothetical protein
MAHNLTWRAGINTERIRSNEAAMTETLSSYAVGRGKPPLHTRFRKGQSGNPSGKPGPAKLAKQRFERAFYAALEASEQDLERSKSDNVIAEIARRMALDAAAGRASAVKLVLTLLEAQSSTPARAEDDGAEQPFTAAELFSLLLGKNQGNEKMSLEDLLWPEAQEKPKPAAGNASEEPGGEPARNEADSFSLVQGKEQGNEKNPMEQICTISSYPCGEESAPAKAVVWTETSCPPSEKRSRPASVENFCANAFFDLPARGEVQCNYFPWCRVISRETEKFPGANLFRCD